MEKKEKYELLLQQVESLVDGEKNEVGVLANVTAAIAETMQLGGVLSGEEWRTDVGTVPRTGGMLSYWLWQGCVRRSLETGIDTCGARCGGVPWAYSLFIAESLGDCGAAV